ncbi:MAG: PEGA domain-containing protein [Planctomycetota bacterium]|jgi:hypothetical protein
MRPLARPPWLPAALALLLLSLTGCVERALLIRSEPAGARVFVDGASLGETPLRMPFDFYGTREVMVRWEPTELGETSYAPVTEQVELNAPWYQYFPIDLLAEFVWPGTIVDEHLFECTLRPQSLGAMEARFEESARAAGLSFPKDAPAPGDGGDR